MPVYLYPRGAEWRKWDLHVHTPHSVLNNGFGNDFDRYAETLLRSALGHEIAAIGVTDYFGIDGYKELLERVGSEQWLTARFTSEEAQGIQSLLLIPNIELRLFVVRGEGGQDSRTNYHVLFSNELSSEEIDEHFLRRLMFTSGSRPGRVDERLPLTSANLVTLGQKLKSQHKEFRGSDLEIGMTTAIVAHEDVSEILARDRRFSGKYLLVAPADEDLSEIGWDGQGHLARKLAIQKSHMLFSANPATREFGLGMKHPTVAAFVAEFETIKPCIHGSDSHDDASLFEPAQERHLWIKADPTWFGLRQLLNEPADRVFIGQTPPEIQRFRLRTANTVSSVIVGPVDRASYDGSWFDVELPMNPGMSAIIGHRGSGKSALAEVVALVGSTKSPEAFSFLSEDRFRNPRDDVAADFQASLTWVDGATDGPTSLDRNPVPTAVERVLFIGQGHLETICNEITSGEDSEFYAELEKVIFSHVADPDRQGFASLRALLAFLAEQEEKSIGQALDMLRRANADIVVSRDRMQAKYAQELRAQLDELNRQLAAHDQTKPAEVAAPEESADTEPMRQARDNLTARHEALNIADAEVDALRTEDAVLARRVTVGTRLVARLNNLKTYVTREIGEAAAEFQELGLDAATIVTFTVDLNPVQTLVQQSRTRRVAIASALDPAREGSAAHRRAAVALEIQALQRQLTTPQRRYEDYRAALAAWETRRREIVGDPETPETIRAVEARIADLAAEPSRLVALRRQRRRAVLEIYQHKEIIRQIYARYHEPVAEFLATNPIAQAEGFKLEFNAAIAQQGAADTILGWIDRRRVGPFAGVDEGVSALEDRIERTDWGSVRDVIRFVESVEANMLQYGDRTLVIESQLVQGADPAIFLSDLFGLGFLQPIYELRWDGRDLEELSPGERGNLLLIFYLLVDRADTPLIIDQPEENLDNETIVRTLVPCLRDARRRRQIVVVTHNANLAVVCDADQVICASMDKSAGNHADYISGSIEDPIINRRIVDVLEGTMIAFESRAAKYLERLGLSSDAA